MTIEQAYNTALWEYEIYYEADLKKQVQNTKDKIELAFIQNVARATDAKGKYEYGTIEKIEEVMKIPKTEERLKRIFNPDEYYEEHKEAIDRREEGRLAQQRLNEIMNQH